VTGETEKASVSASYVNQILWKCFIHFFRRPVRQDVRLHPSVSWYHFVKLHRQPGIDGVFSHEGQARGKNKSSNHEKKRRKKEKKKSLGETQFVIIYHPPEYSATVSYCLVKIRLFCFGIYYSVSIKYVKVGSFQGMLQAGKVVCFSLLTHFCS